MAPSAVAVTSWRKVLFLVSPATNTPGTLVVQLSSDLIYPSTVSTLPSNIAFCGIRPTATNTAERAMSFSSPVTLFLTLSEVTFVSPWILTGIVL